MPEVSPRLALDRVKRVNEDIGVQGWRSGESICHQCGLGLIPRFGPRCGLTLLVLCSAPRGFSPGTPVFLCSRKPTLILISALALKDKALK